MGQRDQEREEMADAIRALITRADDRGEFHVSAHLNQALVALVGAGLVPRPQEER